MQTGSKTSTPFRSVGINRNIRSAGSGRLPDVAHQEPNWPLASGYATLDCTEPVVAQVVFASIGSSGTPTGMATVFSSQAGTGIPVSGPDIGSHAGIRDRERHQPPPPTAALSSRTRNGRIGARAQVRWCLRSPTGRDDCSINSSRFRPHSAAGRQPFPVISRSP